MSRPPQFTQIGTQTIADSTPSVTVNCKVGLQSTITATASDPESDALTYSAFFLQSGMTFDTSTHTLTWTPPGPIGSVNYVRLEATTPSGGTDAVIAVLNTVPALSPSAMGHLRASTSMFRVLGPNPTNTGFTIEISSWAPTPVSLVIFDILGRRVATLRGKPGSTIVWNTQAAPAPPGEYVYRLTAGREHLEGKLLVSR